MGSLSETAWDVILSGERALSRSGKKVLHIDKNDYYGGAQAALSLQEAEVWAQPAEEGARPSPFRNATITNHEQVAPALTEGARQPELGFSRAYSLSLSPQLIYNRSNLLPALVSSKIYRQLDFLAVGSWWLYITDGKDEPCEKGLERGAASPSKGSLQRIPGGREDVFADTSIDRPSSMALMKFLKLAADAEAHASILEIWGQRSFPDFLESHLRIPTQVQAPLIALTLSPDPPANTLTSFALPRIHRHLTSIGMFGPGFGSVVPKWGGLAEVAQVACRSGAVGGGVYLLKKGFEAGNDPGQQLVGSPGTHGDEGTQVTAARLEGGEEVKTRWIVGSSWDLPSRMRKKSSEDNAPYYVARSITIVSGSLSQLFATPVEGAPSPAGAVIVFPTGSITLGKEDQTSSIPETDVPPVYLMVHSSDTGECPAGQCVIYGQTSNVPQANARSFLQAALERLLASINEDLLPLIVWQMHYDQEKTLLPALDHWEANIKCEDSSNPCVLQLPDLAPEMVLEDDVLKHVRAAYDKIMGDEAAPFMIFEDREGQGHGFDEGDDV